MELHPCTNSCLYVTGKLVAGYRCDTIVVFSQFRSCISQANSSDNLSDAYEPWSPVVINLW